MPSKELNNLLKRVQTFQRRRDEFVIAAVLDAEPEILDLHEAQLDAGISGSGRKIRPPYTAFTKRIKREKGQPTDRVTLEDEGDYRASRHLVIDGIEIKIIATDPKARKLSRKYGPEILEFTTVSIGEIGDIIRPAMQSAFKRLLNVSS